VPHATLFARETHPDGDERISKGEEDEAKEEVEEEDGALDALSSFSFILARLPHFLPSAFFARHFAELPIIARVTRLLFFFSLCLFLSLFCILFFLFFAFIE
jgi:hypothetical protein